MLIKNVLTSISESFNYKDKTNVVFLNTGDILEGKFLHSNFSDVKTLPGQAKKSIKHNDILYSEIRPINKHFALVNFEETNNYVVSTKLMVLRNISESYNTKFIYQYLTSDKVIYDLQTMAESRSGTFPQITYEQLSTIDLPDISLDEQQHIVNILGSIDEKIENNDLLSQKYESFLKNLYLKYFSKNNIDLSNYTQYNLTDLANFTGGYSYKGSELVPSSYGLLTIKNFDRNTGFKLDGFKDLSQENKAKNNQYIDQFDIVVAHTDLTQNAEIIGNAEIVLNNSSYEKLVASMDLVIVRPKELISNSLLYILLHNPDFKKHALGYCAGTTVLHLNKRALNEYVVYIPKDKNIKNKLEDIVDKIIKKQASLIKQNIILNKLKSLYLKKFFG